MRDIMSRYRKLDANGDYVLGTGGDFLINTPDLVAQSVLTRLRLFATEWYLDQKEGTPWRTEVLGKYTQDAYDTVLKQRILGTTGVRGITQYASAFNGSARTLTVTATLDTIYGTAALQGTL